MERIKHYRELAARINRATKTTQKLLDEIAPNGVLGSYQVAIYANNRVAFEFKHWGVCISAQKDPGTEIGNIEPLSQFVTEAQLEIDFDRVSVVGENAKPSEDLQTSLNVTYILQPPDIKNYL